MSCFGKVSRTFEFLRLFGAAEKIQAKVQGAAEKNKEKVEANWLLSRVLWFSVATLHGTMASMALEGR